MKFSNQSERFACFLTIALTAFQFEIISPSLRAAEPKETQPKLPDAQLSFASPDEASIALKKAAATKDRDALSGIFGPQFHELLTGDKTLDANNAQRFADALAEACKPVEEGNDKIFFEIGTNGFPMAIPLVKVGGQWHFDTAAGKEEIINRHIGKDELHAIGACRAYVTAQRQYASANPEPSGGTFYAQKLLSTPGKKDGLYWRAAEHEPASPLGALVAMAQAEGYVRSKGGAPQPFHGYYFKILTRQGKSAPGGKMNYLSRGSLTGGFALVAYPEHWGQSGIMTFIINQDGKLFQQDLGEKTSRIAGSMKEYDPDSAWTLVKDEGILSTPSEK